MKKSTQQLKNKGPLKFQRSGKSLNIKQEMHHISILDDIFLPF